MAEDEGYLDGAAGSAEGGRILFSCCKKETHTHKAGFKQLFRRLRSMFRPEKLDSKEDLTMSNLSQAAVLVLGCPTELFTAHEFEVLKRFVKGGGSLLVFLAEGGEAKAGTNINYLLEEFGISVNNDAVVRVVHHKYLHPKEVLISDGVLNRGILAAVGKGSEEDELARSGAAFDGSGLDFVYPYGASLSVQAPAVPIISSGKVAYPMNRPLGEQHWVHVACPRSALLLPPCSPLQPTPTCHLLHAGAVLQEENGGRIAVFGSVSMFDDKWLDKEENSKLMDFVFKWARPGSRVGLHPADCVLDDLMTEGRISDLKLLPDTTSLAGAPRWALRPLLLLHMSSSPAATPAWPPPPHPRPSRLGKGPSCQRLARAPG